MRPCASGIDVLPRQVPAALAAFLLLACAAACAPETRRSLLDVSAGPGADAAVPDRPDAGGPMADGGPSSDGGPAEDGGDAGRPDAGGEDAGTHLTLSVDLEDTQHQFLAVDPAGVVYAAAFEASGVLVASSDRARTFVPRGTLPPGTEFFMMAYFGGGTLLADVVKNGLHSVARSEDRGATWTDVLSLGNYRTLTPHNFAELGGTFYVLEYQDFTGENTPIHLHASADGGRTWTTRYTFQGHRHGHGMRSDPARGALWAYFGDTTPQCGVYRSTDGGSTWTLMQGGQEGDVVDAEVLPEGDLLFGQDISFLPDLPGVARVGRAGGYTLLRQIPGPAYSTHAIGSGGFVVGAAREANGDLYPPGEVSAHLLGSVDGLTWDDLLSFPRANPNEDVRADVYWELPSGELVLELRNAAGIGPYSVGFQLLRVGRR